MSELGPVYQPETEGEYTAWVTQHKHDGYVINAHKTGAAPMYWHRADCGHIRPDGSTPFIERDYFKACALDPGALAVWAKQRPEPLNYCKDCAWKWDKEHGVTT